MKTDHENTKVRKPEGLTELAQTPVNFLTTELGQIPAKSL